MQLQFIRQYGFIWGFFSLLSAGEDTLNETIRFLQKKVRHLELNRNMELLERTNCEQEKDKCCMQISALLQANSEKLEIINDLKQEKTRSKKSIKFLRDVVKAKSDENDRNKEAIQQLMVDKLNLEKIIEKQKNN